MGNQNSNKENRLVLNTEVEGKSIYKNFQYVILLFY